MATTIELNNLNAQSHQHIIQSPQATFIKVHFQTLTLQTGDFVTVSAPNGDYSRSYPGDSFTHSPEEEGFWALSVPGDTAVITLHQNNQQNTLSSIIIDQYIHGYAQNELVTAPDSSCGSNQRTDVACYADSYPTEFGNSHAVARILKNGTTWCTGWRVTPQNFFFTNEHCITSQAELESMEFWFNYQRPNCGAGDPSTDITIVTGDQFLIDDDNLDFALITLDDFAAVQSFGHLNIDPRPAILNERIYIPQHGAGHPKEFGIESDLDSTGLCAVQHTAAVGWTNEPTDIGYFCDTTSGSSGSPVIAASNHRVIAIHHFGTTANPVCHANGDGSGLNRGVRFEEIWPLVAPFLPPLQLFDFEVAPLLLDVCQGDTAVYDITISTNTTNNPVHLTTANLLVGAVSDFTVNPIESTGTSTLVISNTAVITPTVHPIQIIATNSTDTLTHTVQLNVSATVPASTTLNSPADGATDVQLMPELTWTAVSEAQNYQLEIATDSNFTTPIYSATVPSSSTNHQLMHSLLPNTTYYWRVSPTNACGSAIDAPINQFTTIATNLEITPTILSVTQFIDQQISHTFTLTNSDNIPLNWQLAESNNNCNATTDLDWLSTQPTSDQIEGQTTQTITVHTNSATLSAGTYHGSLCLISDDPVRSVAEIPVSLTVLPYFETYLPFTANHQ